MLLVLVGALGIVAYKKRDALRVGPFITNHSAELQHMRNQIEEGQCDILRAGQGRVEIIS